jgi:hypothetical protein
MFLQRCMFGTAEGSLSVTCAQVKLQLLVLILRRIKGINLNMVSYVVSRGFQNYPGFIHFNELSWRQTIFILLVDVKVVLVVNISGKCDVEHCVTFVILKVDI